MFPKIQKDECTEPGKETWSVNWNFTKGVDTHVLNRLATVFGGEAGNFRDFFQFRKEFCSLHSGDMVLEGGSTYDFGNWTHAEIGGVFTPNVIRMGEYEGRDVAVMIYRKPPFFCKNPEFGFVDLFVPLVLDESGQKASVVLAPGGYGHYNKDWLECVFTQPFHMVR